MQHIGTLGEAEDNNGKSAQDIKMITTERVLKISRCYPKFELDTGVDTQFVLFATRGFSTKI
jgi:hypothetical protein